MTVWLLDASVLLACEDADDAHHTAARRLLTGPDPLATLDLALYEVTNVAVSAWKDHSAARRLCALIGAVAADGGMVRAEPPLLEAAADLALTHALSAHDAAYVAAAAAAGARLVSCDVRDLISRGLAESPADAVAQIRDTPGA